MATYGDPPVITTSMGGTTPQWTSTHPTQTVYQTITINLDAETIDKLIELVTARLAEQTGGKHGDCRT